jgi:hypothetical protein
MGVFYLLARTGKGSLVMPEANLTVFNKPVLHKT